jgi:hypothetical protein
LNVKILFDTTTAADRLLFLTLLLLSVAGLFFINKILPERKTVLIDADGKPAYTLPLSEDRTVSVDGPEGKSVVEIRRSRVRIIDSPCRNRLCIQQGWVTSGAIVCLPNRVVVTIQGRDTDHGVFDAVTR